MRTRDMGKSLAQIHSASDSVCAAMKQAAPAGAGNHRIDARAFLEAKDAYNAWCKSVEWYLALCKGNPVPDVSPAPINEDIAHDTNADTPDPAALKASFNQCAYKLSVTNAKVLRCIYDGKPLDTELVAEVRGACEGWLRVVGRAIAEA